MTRAAQLGRDAGAHPRHVRSRHLPAPPTQFALISLLGLLGLVSLISPGLSSPALAQNARRRTASEEPATRAPAASQSSAQPGSSEAGDDEQEHPVVGAQFRQWLEEVEPLISQREKDLFLSLREDYQRDAFTRRFWQSRDPFPQTPRNELRDRYTDRVEMARSYFESLDEDRARIYLLHGTPTSGFEVRCTTTRIPFEVWGYAQSEVLDFPFMVVFYRPSWEEKPRVWRPGPGVNIAATFENARRCINGERLEQVVSFLNSPENNYDFKLRQVLAKPRPRSQEWLDTFLASSTEVPDDAESFAAAVSLSYPGRRDSRTVLQGVISVPSSAAEIAEFAGHRSYDFIVTGEVILGDQLFEGFRYKFGFPAAGFQNTELPLAFQRQLRPGSYRLAVRVEDVNAKRFFRFEDTVDVPALDTLLPPPPPSDPETAEIFREATAAIARGETRIRILPPHGELQTGLVRIDTLATGSQIDKVAFYLDTQQVMVKNRPPYNVEVDLGHFPRRHVVRVAAFDGEEQEVASDEIELNSGGNRFAIRLLEPRRGQHYERSLEARAEVEVPQGSSLDRVEIFLDDERVATLYQEPFVQPLALPAHQEISYVRAVAYTPDGHATEDVAFINAPDYLEEIDVQFVELYTTVLDGQGRPIGDLGREDFEVLEDGHKQEIARFEKVEDLPIHVGILIDNSGSMRETLGEVRKAALSFLEQAIHPKDRAAIITFNKFPRLAVKLTNDLTSLGGGLAGLSSEGETALYDSLIFSLYYFTGVRGQRAILLLSDGRDESSRFDFADALEYARRAGVTIYPIGLNLTSSDARGKLQHLAQETGGRSFFIRGAEELETIYRSIQDELRSQYLIAYQSSSTEESSRFRAVELKVHRPRARAHTISGYYP